MTDHGDYLKLLATITAQLPAVRQEELEAVVAHADAWDRCETCASHAASESALLPEEIAFIEAHARAFPDKHGAATVNEVKAKPAGRLVMTLTFKSYGLVMAEADRVARAVSGGPGLFDE